MILSAETRLRVVRVVGVHSGIKICAECGHVSKRGAKSRVLWRHGEYCDGYYLDCTQAGPNTTACNMFLSGIPSALQFFQAHFVPVSNSMQNIAGRLEPVW